MTAIELPRAIKAVAPSPKTIICRRCIVFICCLPVYVTLFILLRDELSAAARFGQPQSQPRLSFTSTNRAFRPRRCRPAPRRSTGHGFLLAVISKAIRRTSVNALLDRQGRSTGLSPRRRVLDQRKRAAPEGTAPDFRLERRGRPDSEVHTAPGG